MPDPDSPLDPSPDSNGPVPVENPPSDGSPGVPEPPSKHARTPLLHHPVFYGALVLAMLLTALLSGRAKPDKPEAPPSPSAFHPHGWLQGAFADDDEADLPAALLLPPLILGSGLLIGYIVLRSYNIRVFPRCDFPTVPWTAWHLLRCAILFLAAQQFVVAVVACLRCVKPIGAWIDRLPPVLVDVQEYNVIMAATCGLILALVAAGGIQPGPTLGLTEPHPVRRAALGAVAYVMIFPVLFLVHALVHFIYTVFKLNIPSQQVLLEARSLPSLAFLAFGVSVVVVAPVTEEFLFRGFLYGTLRRYLGPLGAICLSAAAFAVAHEFAYGIPPLFVLGFLFAYLYERTGSLVAPIAAHAVHNLFALVTFRLLHTPGLWMSG